MESQLEDTLFSDNRDLGCAAGSVPFVGQGSEGHALYVSYDWNPYRRGRYHCAIVESRGPEGRTDRDFLATFSYRIGDAGAKSAAFSAAIDELRLRIGR